MSSIVLFDGPLQSETGQRLRGQHAIQAETDSLVLIKNGKAFTYSDAGLRIAKGMGGIWQLAYVFMIVPKRIRDWVYKLVAKHRYRFFGKRKVCMMPTPEVRERFLE